jgi:putative oxidoreductase
MRIVGLIARYLLGLIFVVFGANGFLHFIPMPPPSGIAGQFMGALFVSHVLVVIFLLELIGGLLLLVGRFVPLGLVLLGPVVVNIVLFHAFMAPSGLPLATVVVILWLLTAWTVRPAFEGIFRSKA